MVDEVSEILNELDAETPDPATGRKVSADVALAERSSHSGTRLSVPGNLFPEVRNCFVPIATKGGHRPGSVRQAIEAVAVAREGGVMLIGWVDDTECALDSVLVSCGTWQILFDAKSLVRVRRPDVEGALGVTTPYLYGYFGLVAAAELQDAPASVQIEVRLKNGGFSPATQTCRTLSAEGLRDLALGYLASSLYLGNPQAEAVTALERGVGAQAVALNRNITSRITKARHIERFGIPKRQPKGSIIVCLYGKPEFLFVQSALFAARPGIEDYEFIYVCNSPEINDALLAEAHAARMIYGLQQTVVLLPGNAGFGAANNAGAAAALGKRILNVNPDVFPRQLDWAAQHTALVEQRPPHETRLFGVPLYYDDGSLMHGGMYFEMDPAVVMRDGQIDRRRLARVEHYGKGAPPGATTYTRARPVPAVTGAFISSDREWYEALGGFNEDYIFGHYEDADLCLKSLVRGRPAWLHDLRLWHLEGKGSTRRPHHEGGSLVNRWLFTRTWFPEIADGMCGPKPTHPAMSAPTSLLHTPFGSFAADDAPETALPAAEPVTAAGQALAEPSAVVAEIAAAEPCLVVTEPAAAEPSLAVAGPAVAALPPRMTEPQVPLPSRRRGARRMGDMA
jgi:GT2 family glycosyltransferase